MIRQLRMLRGVIAACSIALVPAAFGAQAPRIATDRVQRVDQFIDRTIARGEVTGGVALVAIDGKVVHLTARGNMDTTANKPMQKNSIFRLASMTKPVAAVAILMLVEEGKVRLDDPVSKYLPTYREMKVAGPRAAGGSGATPTGPATPSAPVAAERQVTVLDVLTHTSGVMSGGQSNAGGQAAFSQRHELGLKWVDNLGKDAVLEFQPGARWAYSAVAGLDISNRIVEVVTGQSFRDYAEARIFKPLGMTETFYWPTAAQRQRLVSAYNFANGVLTPISDPDSMSGEKYFGGGGGLMSTAESYARFAMMLANGGELNGVRILSPAMVKLMGSQIIPDTLPGRRAGEGYGLGVRHINDRAARRTLIADDSFGWSGMYGTHFWVDPSRKLVAILLMQTPGQSRTEEFETAVMQAVLD